MSLAQLTEDVTPQFRQRHHQQATEHIRHHLLDTTTTPISQTVDRWRAMVTNVFPTLLNHPDTSAAMGRAQLNMLMMTQKAVTAGGLPDNAPVDPARLATLLTESRQEWTKQLTAPVDNDRAAELRNQFGDQIPNATKALMGSAQTIFMAIRKSSPEECRRRSKREPVATVEKGATRSRWRDDQHGCVGRDSVSACQ